MHRYNQNTFNNSFINNSNPLHHNHDHLVTSSDMVIVEEDAHLIHEQLSEVQTRLKNLSKSNKPSGTKQTNSYLKSIQKNEKNKLSFNKVQKKLSFTPQRRCHIDQIRFHLQQLEQQLMEEKQGYSNIKNKQKILKLQQSQKCMKNQICQLESTIEKLKYEHKKEKQDMQKKFNNQLQKKQNQYKQIISEIQINQDETIREQKLNLQNVYLLKEQELINQIDTLSNNLQIEVNKFNKLKAQVNTIQQEHIKQICELQKQLQASKLQVEKLKDECKLQRQLKVQNISKFKQTENENKIIRQNNKRFINQINENKQNLEKYIKQALPIFELINSFIQILNKFHQYQLPTSIQMMKSQLNYKRFFIKNIIYQHQNQINSQCNQICIKSTDRTTCQYSEDFRSYNQDKQNRNSINSSAPKRKKEKSQCKSNKHMNLLNNFAEEYNGQHSDNDLYKMLLVQAASIQSKVN